MTKPTFKELIDAVFAGKTIQYGFLNESDPAWKDMPYDAQTDIIASIARFFKGYQYRIKPDKKVIQYRNYLTTDGKIGIWQSGISTPYAYQNSSEFKWWINELQEYEMGDV